MIHFKIDILTIREVLRGEILFESDMKDKIVFLGKFLRQEMKQSKYTIKTFPLLSCNL